MHDVLSITMKQTKLSLQGFSATSRKKAEELYRKAQKSDFDKQILLMQKAMAINPFAAKYQKAYAEILYKIGHAEQALEHMQKAHGLNKAHRTIAKLKIPGKSIHAAAITQYYTGIFADWTQGYTIAAHILHQARQKSYTGKSTVHFASLPKKGENPEENKHKKTNTRWLNRSSSEAEIENTTLTSLSYPNRWSIVAKTSKKYPGKALKIIATITLLLCLKLTITNPLQAQTAGGFGTVFVGDEVNFINGRYAKVTYTMIEDTDQIREFEATSSGFYWFNDINLIPTHVNKPNTQQQPNIINYTSQGQDHNITTPKTTEQAKIYTIHGQAIARLQSNSNSNYSHFYWNPNNIPAGIYIFTTNINGYPVSQKLLQTNSNLLVGKLARNNLESDHNARWLSNQPTGSMPHNSLSNDNARWLRDSRNENRLETTDNTPLETRNNKNQKELTTATFLVHLEPGTNPQARQFLPQTDTITLHEGEDNYPIHYVQPIPQKVHQTLKLIDEQTHQPLTNFTIRGRASAEGEIFDETQTDTNGNATLIFPPNTAIRLEYGPETEHGADTSYYASKGNIWNTQNVHYANDTINHDTIRLALPNKNLIIPKKPGDPSPETIWTQASYVREMLLVGGTPQNPSDYVAVESAVRNEIRIWLSDEYASNSLNTILTLSLPTIDSLFYGEQQEFPYTIVENEIDVNGIPSNQYNHTNNYYPGLLGFNVRPGGAQVSLKTKENYSLTIINNENTNKIDAILGAEIQTSSTVTTFTKEFKRANGINDVSSRVSCMNTTSAPATLYDRAIFHTIQRNQKNQAEQKNHYSLRSIVDEF